MRRTCRPIERRIPQINGILSFSRLSLLIVCVTSHGITSRLASHCTTDGRLCTARQDDSRRHPASYYGLAVQINTAPHEKTLNDAVPKRHLVTLFAFARPLQIVIIIIIIIILLSSSSSSASRTLAKSAIVAHPQMSSAEGGGVRFQFPHE